VNESEVYKGVPWIITVTACAMQNSQSVLYQTMIAHFKTGVFSNLPKS